MLLMAEPPSDEQPASVPDLDRMEPPSPEQFHGTPEPRQQLEVATESGTASHIDSRCDDERYVRTDGGAILPIDEVGASSQRPHRAQSVGPSRDHLEATAADGSDQGSGQEYVWRPDRVIGVLVDSRMRETAITLARVTLDHLKSRSGERIDDERVTATLVADVETVPPELGGSLPSSRDALPTGSDRGAALLESFIEETAWRGELSQTVQQALQTANGIRAPSHLYNQYGEPVVSRPTFDEYDKDSTWLVPAIVQQRELDPTGRVSEDFTCRMCGKETAHLYEGPVTEPRPDIPSPGVWVCRRCETPQTGPHR